MAPSLDARPDPECSDGAHKVLAEVMQTSGMHCATSKDAAKGPSGYSPGPKQLCRASDRPGTGGLDAGGVMDRRLTLRWGTLGGISSQQMISKAINTLSSLRQKTGYGILRGQTGCGSTKQQSAQFGRDLLIASKPHPCLWEW